MKFTLIEDNELEKRAKKHKATDKKGARGWFVHPNPGDPKAISSFNHSVDTGSAPVGGGESGGCCESLEDNDEELWSAVCNNDIDYVKEYYKNGGDINKTYNAFNRENSLIMGALRNGNYEMFSLLNELGCKITDEEKHEFDQVINSQSNEIKHCEKCGTRLNDSEECPLCDLGDETVLEK